MIVDIYEYFKNNPRLNTRIGNNFILAEYQCPLNVDEFTLWTKSHMILYVINGKKDWHTPNKTFCLKGGDILFVKKGVYTTKQYFEEDYCAMLFFMNDDFIKDFINENNIQNNTDSKTEDSVLPITADNSFNTLVESIFQYLTKGQAIPQNLVELKFKELIFNILLNKKNSHFKSMLCEISKSSKANIEHIMNTNFQYDLSLEGFAKLSGRSLSTFKRDFKRYFKTTPSKWLMDKRLQYSKMLLTSSEMNINEVCFESGFKNASHFIKSFKSQFNCTPNQFKANKSIA